MPERNAISWEVSRFLALKRTFFVAAGLSASAAAVLLAGWSAIGLDVLLSLHSVVRWCALALVAGGGLWCLMWLTVLPLFRCRRARAIMQIEEGHPDLGQRLRTAQEVSDPASRPAWVSPVLADALVEETQGRLATIDPGGLIPWLRMAGGLALFAMSMLLSGVLLMFSRDCRTGVDRLLKPSAPITFTTVEGTCSRRMPGLGSAVEFGAVVGGRPVQEATLHIRPVDGEWETLPLEEAEEDSFRASWTGDAVGTYEWFTEAGDGRTPLRTFRVVIYPKVNDVSATLVYPGYTGVPPQEVEGGDLTALEGTQAEAVFTLNHAVAEARVVLSSGDALEARPVDSTVVASLPVSAGDVTYYLQGEDFEGLPIERRVYSIRGTPDRLPRVEISSPPPASEVTAITEVPVRARASDDFGIRELQVTLRIRGEEKTLCVLRPQGTTRTRCTVAETLMLEEHDLSFRDDVQLVAKALDHKPGRTEPGVSAIHYIDIRPFFRRYRTGVANGDQSRDSLALEKLVAWQRLILSRTYQATQSRSSDREQTEKLVLAEAEVQSKTARFRELLEQAPMVPAEVIDHVVPHLTAAEEHMAQAVSRLEAEDLEAAQQKEEEALGELLQARMELIETRMRSQATADELTKIDEQILPEMEPPDASSGEREDLERLAEEAERLADEELAIRQGVSASPLPDGRMPQRQQHEDRQRQVAAGTRALREGVEANAAATEVARERAQAAEETVTDAAQEIANDDGTGAVGTLAEAEAELRRLAEHLEGLAEDEPAERLDRTSRMASELSRLLGPEQGRQEGSGRQAAPGQRPGGRDQAYEDARSLRDLLADLARQTDPETATLAERVRELAERHGVSHLPEDVSRADAAREDGETRRAERIEQAAAKRLEGLTRGLDMERRALQQGYLGRLTAAEREASALGGQLAEDAADGQVLVPQPTAARMQDLGTEAKGLADPELERLAEMLLGRLEHDGGASWSAGGIVVPEAVVGESLEPMALRLQQLIQEAMRDQLPADASRRVPDRYIRLVERYYRALSDDLR